MVKPNLTSDRFKLVQAYPKRGNVCNFLYLVVHFSTADFVRATYEIV
jgi:hypothetical protein